MGDTDTVLDKILRQMWELDAKTELVELLDAGRVYLEAAAELKQAELASLQQVMLPQEESAADAEIVEEPSPWLGAPRPGHRYCEEVNDED